MTSDDNPNPKQRIRRKKPRLPPPRNSRDVLPYHSPPPLDPYLEDRPPLERSTETLRYSLDRLDESGEIQSWFRFHLRIFLGILIPLLLFFLPLSYLTHLLFVITEDVIATYQNLREHFLLFGFCGVVIILLLRFLIHLFRD